MATETTKDLFVQSGRTVSSLSSQEKDELNKLSQEVFGASSRWRKLIDKGTQELITEETTEYIPNAEDESKEGTTQKVQTPVKTAGGALQYRTKRYTVDSIKAYMLEAKTRLDFFKAQFKRMQDEQAAKKAQEEANKVVQELAGGSVI